MRSQLCVSFPFSFWCKMSVSAILVCHPPFTWEKMVKKTVNKTINLRRAGLGIIHCVAIFLHKGEAFHFNPGIIRLLQPRTKIKGIFFFEARTKPFAITAVSRQGAASTSRSEASVCVTRERSCTARSVSLALGPNLFPLFQLPISARFLSAPHPERWL